MISDQIPNGNNDKFKGERTQKQRQTVNGVQAHSTIGKCCGARSLEGFGLTRVTVGVHSLSIGLLQIAKKRRTNPA
jgi:hypothetical protein